MFGYDFKADHDALSERIETASPEDSLILQKPTLQEEHEGGKRFEKDNWEYKLLHRWIEAGAKGAAGEPRQADQGERLLHSPRLWTRLAGLLLRRPGG